MALTKADLVEAVMQTSGLTKAQCFDIVDSILSIVKDRLAVGEDVIFPRKSGHGVKPQEGYFHIPAGLHN